MTNSVRLYFSRPRIDDPNLLVLARGQQLGTVPVEAGAVDDVRVAVYLDQCLTRP